MRRIQFALLALILMGLASPATAQLFKDDFTGAVGDTLNTHGYSIVGSGSIYLNPITIVSPGLTYGTFAGSGVGNAVVLKNAGQDLGALFKADSVKTGPVYAAFLVNVSSVSGGDYFFSFLPSLTTASYPCRVYAKTDSAGGLFFGVSKTSETAVYGTTHYSLNTTYLLVAKFTLVPGSNNDLISLYVFSGGNLEAVEPATAEIQDYNGSSKGDLPAVSVCVMRQGGGAAPVLTFDGLRVGTTWATALGIEGASAFGVTPSSVDFGEVSLDSAKTASLTVTNNSASSSLVIDSVTSSRGVFSVNPGGTTLVATKSAYYTVTYQPTAVGVDTGLIVFHHDASSGQDTVVVVGTCVHRTAALVLGTRTLSFGRVLVNTTRTDSVIIRNSGELTLTISGVASKDTSLFGAILDADSVLAGDSTYVKVTFRPQTLGEKSDTIVFSSNAPQGFDTLFVNGISGEPAAMFSIAPKSVSFGSVRLGQEKSDTLLIRNAGEKTLNISGFTQKDTSFHVTMESDSVKAGDSMRVFVRFAPAATGSHRDTVVFTSNAVEVTDTLTLSGTANDIITIAAARALPNSSEVIVRGIVTRVLGSYTFIQDTTGGIIMYSNAAGQAAHDSVASGYIKKGDLLEINGKTSEYKALKEIGTTGILGFQRISRGNLLPAPQVVTVAELDTNGEKYEAKLITVKKLSFTGSVTTFSNSTSYPVGDSSDNSGTVVLRIQGATDTQLGGLTAPTGTFTFTGVLGQFSSSATGGYQLLPVDTTDVVADVVEGVAALPTGVPDAFDLEQNYPNPFNPTTTIQYALPAESRVTVTIYSVLGQAIRTLVSETQKASYYRVVWDGLNEAKAPVATGIYFYRISAEPVAKDGTPFVQVRKMIMLK